MKVGLAIVAAAVAYAAWRWASLLLDPLGLGEFLFIGRIGLIVGSLTAMEAIYRKVLP